ncbi:MAG: hypothetical protein A2289_01820 [Deltaproteobacteria bacterium RIFOXYA12_FULL_58_15]|nr:MAG: hypothetical protein A2289_01820 [Deltaproteobacteria bacterium RIFOXYA12_FULL_58_15]
MSSCLEVRLSSANPRILVIEDDRVVRRVFETLLPSEGYYAQVVEDAEQGLQMLVQQPFDLIISDIMLPGMDGIELCRRVKETQPDLDVILMTAYASMDNVLAAMAAGVYDFLVKPFEDLNEVLHKIAKAIEKRQIVRENRQLVEYLQQANAQIEGMNRALEAKVVERTQELERLAEKLEQLTLTDDVTGAYNQRFLNQRIVDEFGRAQRYGHGLSIVMVDLDNFKQVNDTHDHLFGTAVLRRVAEVFTRHLRQTDLVVRYGGDEFCLLLPSTRLSDAVPASERLRLHLSQANVGGSDDVYRVTGSFGVASYGECVASTPQELLGAADKALYLAKETGRNRVAVMHGQDPVAIVA